MQKCMSFFVLKTPRHLPCMKQKVVKTRLKPIREYKKWLKWLKPDLEHLTFRFRQHKKTRMARQCRCILVSFFMLSPASFLFSRSLFLRRRQSGHFSWIRGSGRTLCKGSASCLPSQYFRSRPPYRPGRAWRPGRDRDCLR